MPPTLYETGSPLDLGLRAAGEAPNVIGDALDSFVRSFPAAGNATWNYLSRAPQPVTGMSPPPIAAKVPAPSRPLAGEVTPPETRATDAGSDDFALGPSDVRWMGNYLANEDKARAGVAARAFTPTADSWNPSGGARSLAQMESDARARAILDAVYEPEFGRIARDDARLNDPMGKALEARKKTLAYEQLLPAGAEPILRSSVVPRGAQAKVTGTDANGNPLYDVEQSPTGVTRGQMDSFERELRLAQAKNFDPKKALDVQQAAARQQELEGIQVQKARLLQQVQAGALKPEEYEDRMRKIILDAATRGALLEGDISGLARLLYPTSDQAIAQEMGGRSPGRQ